MVLFFPSSTIHILNDIKEKTSSIFSFVFTIFAALSLFLKFKVYFWYHLPSAWRISINIYFRTFRLITNSQFYFVENVFILPLLLENILMDKDFWVASFYTFGILKMFFHSFQPPQFVLKKIAIISVTSLFFFTCNGLRFFFITFDFH